MTGTQLPGWRTVLGVVAHPDDESFGLGAVLSAFADQNAQLAVLCLTRGEALTLRGVAGELAEIRTAGLAAAAEVLGVSAVELLSYPDGHLGDTPADELAIPVIDFAQRFGAQGLLVFDSNGVTGHRDHQQATAAARVAAAQSGLPVLGWTLPTAVAETLNSEYRTSFTGNPIADIDLVVPVDRDRDRQYQAVRQHPSQGATDQRAVTTPGVAGPRRTPTLAAAHSVGVRYRNAGRYTLGRRGDEYDWWFQLAKRAAAHSWRRSRRRVFGVLRRGVRY